MCTDIIQLQYAINPLQQHSSTRFTAVIIPSSSTHRTHDTHGSHFGNNKVYTDLFPPCTLFNVQKARSKYSIYTIFYTTIMGDNSLTSATQVPLSFQVGPRIYCIVSSFSARNLECITPFEFDSLTPCECNFFRVQCLSPLAKSLLIANRVYVFDRGL